MIFGYRVAKTKLVEQLTLVTLQTAHHGSTSPRFASTQRNHASRHVSTDFCNKICTFRTCRDFRVESAFEGKAEVGSRACQGQLLARRGHSPVMTIRTEHATLLPRLAALHSPSSR